MANAAARPAPALDDDGAEISSTLGKLRIRSEMPIVKSNRLGAKPPWTMEVVLRCLQDTRDGLRTCEVR